MAELPIQNQIYGVNNANLPQNKAVNGSVYVSPAPIAQNTGVTYPLYQYPVASVYGPNNKQATSGVNIFIYNPSGTGAPSTNTYNTNNTSPQTISYEKPAGYSKNGESDALANTSIQGPANTAPVQSFEQNKEKPKNIVELTDDYIKTLESYLRSPDATVRRMGITDLIKRFEEDDSRYNDAALTALLNIALQDPDENNRLLAMSPIASENAHGDENTVALLKNLQSSDKLYGQEAKMAANSILKSVQNKITK